MEYAPLQREYVKAKTAIVLLAYADYESLELALATHARHTVDSGLPIFILQNGRGTYDTERTCAVGKRYEALFPGTVRLVTHIPPQEPYTAIQKLLHDPLFAAYDYVIKLDDDVMTLTPDWVDKLIDCYVQAYAQSGDRLAYVTPLVNNNPFGFKRLIESSDELSREYFARLARPHRIGCGPEDSFNPYRLVAKEEIYDGGFGTIWQLPYIARWLHEKTTLRPDDYIRLTRDLPTVQVDANQRYSINCMLFAKGLWDDMREGGGGDEHMLHAYCLLHKKEIYAVLSVPMVHLAFYSQREEIRDMMPKIREVYTAYLALPFPIAICGDRMIEIENRLRFMETNAPRARGAAGKKSLLKKLKGGIQCYREHGFAYTFHRGLVHLHLKGE